MKAHFIIVLTALLSFGVQAQVEVDGTSINDLDIQALELIGKNQTFGLRINVWVDYGQEPSFRLQSIRDTDGKQQKFNSIVDALNFMDKNGWEYVHNYVIGSGDTLENRYLLRRKSVSQ